ncbi:MAG: FMN-binding protein, partial [Gammaproteobacteria bacterium]
MKIISLRFCLYFCLLVGNQFLPGHVLAVGNYQEPAEFIQKVFYGDAPKVSKIWIRKDLKVKIHEIMGHDLGVLRLKYWEKEGRTAWILEEIGKVRPITAG